MDLKRIVAIVLVALLTNVAAEESAEVLEKLAGVDRETFAAEREETTSSATAARGAVQEALDLIRATQTSMKATRDTRSADTASKVDLEGKKLGRNADIGKVREAQETKRLERIDQRVALSEKRKARKAKHKDAIGRRQTMAEARKEKHASRLAASQAKTAAIESRRAKTTKNKEDAKAALDAIKLSGKTRTKKPRREAPADGKKETKEEKIDRERLNLHDEVDNRIADGAHALEESQALATSRAADVQQRVAEITLKLGSQEEALVNKLIERETLAIQRLEMEQIDAAMKISAMAGAIARDETKRSAQQAAVNEAAQRTVSREAERAAHEEGLEGGGHGALPGEHGLPGFGIM